MMLNPILAFSATRRMRSFRTMLILIAYVVLMLAIAALILAPFLNGNVMMGDMNRGAYCYAALMALQFALIVLIAPAMTSGAIAGERDRQTLELLLVTQTGSLRIVIGKLLESFAMLALLILSGFPVLCLCLLTGGVTMGQIMTGEMYLLAMAFGAASVGLFASALGRTTVISTVIAYLLILAVATVTSLPPVLGYPQRVTDVLYEAKKYAALTSSGAAGMISQLFLLNPGTGLLALAQSQTQFMDPVMEYRGWGRILATWMILERIGWDRLTLICSGAVTLAGAALTGISSLLVRPRERKVRHGK